MAQGHPSESKELRCGRCQSTDLVLVQYTRIDYRVLEVTPTLIMVKTDGEIDYGSVVDERLECRKCFATVEKGDRSIDFG